MAEKTKFPLQMDGKAIHSLLNGRKRFLFIKELSPSALHGQLVPAHVSRIAGNFYSFFKFCFKSKIEKIKTYVNWFSIGNFFINPQETERLDEEGKEE